MQNEIEVMRVVRVPPLGKLVVQIGNNRHKNIDEINNPTARQRILAAIGELVSFAGGYNILVDEGLAPPIVSPDEEMKAPSLQEQQETFLKSLGGAAASPDTDLVEIAPQLLTSAVPATNSKAFNIANQINTIIGKHLANNPKLSARNIELHSEGSGGLLIEVDGRFYDSPTQIEDKEVRLLIKMALREWDKK